MQLARLQGDNQIQNFHLVCVGGGGGGGEVYCQKKMSEIMSYGSAN